MKISSVSKKVLASALSAAMVVAFAPTVAFGAQNGNKVTVKYDLGLGVDTQADPQQQLKLTQEYKVGGTYTAAVAAYVKKDTAVLGSAVTGGKKYVAEADKDKTGAELESATKLVAGTGSFTPGANYYEYVAATPESYATSGQITLATSDDVELISKKDSEGNITASYELVGWDVTYDRDADGKYEIDAYVEKGAELDVSDGEVYPEAVLTAKAVYDCDVISNLAVDFDQYVAAKKGAVIKLQADAMVTSKVNGAGKYVITAPSGTKTEKTDLSTAVPVKAETGKWTIDLVDGYGVTIDTEVFYIGSLTLTGGAFVSYAGSSDTDKVASQTVFFKVNPDAEMTYADVLGETDFTENDKYVKAYELEADGTLGAGETTNYYDASGNVNDTPKTIAKGAAGAVNYKLTALFDDEVKLLSMTAEGGKLTVATAGIGSWIANNDDGKAAVKDPAKKGVDGYYMVVKDAAGNIVGETVDSDSKAGNDVASGNNVEIDITGATTYTATLYKMTAYAAASAGKDAVDGTVKAVANLTADISAMFAAAPTWAYTAAYNATTGAFESGKLSLTNNAGTGYKLYIDGVEYDTAVAGKVYTTMPNANLTVTAEATDPKNKVQESLPVVLRSFDVDVNGSSAMDRVEAVNTAADKTIGGVVTKCYSTDAGVKAAVAAAKKTLTDTGFMVVNATDSEWDALVNAAKQSILEAIADAAQAQINVYAAGIANADGTVTALNADNTAKFIAAADEAVADYAANHDGVSNNNVAGYADDAAAYVDAIDKAVTDAKAAMTKYAKADFDAAQAVTAELKAVPSAADVKAENAKATVAAAEKALADYAALSLTQQTLVASTDTEATRNAMDVANSIIATSDKAAVSKAKGATKKVKLAKAKKAKTTVTIKLAASTVGTKATFKKTSGSKKVTVAKSGKVTLAKVTKKGTYSAKVKATVGASSKTITVKFVVKK